MHALPFAFCALFFAGDSDAAPPESPEAGRAAVVKSLQFLAKDSVDWKEEHKCASCHHVPMTIWALEEGRQAGYAVETAVLDQLTTWVLTDGQARVLPDLEHKNPFNPTIEMAGVYTMLALGARSTWDDAARAAWNRVATHVVATQIPDGSVPSGVGRPPIFERAEALTAYAVLALTPPEREAAQLNNVRTARANAVRWLAETPGSGAHQSRVLRLLVDTRTDGDADRIQAEAASLIQLQEKDGGWRQTAQIAPDALATGQSLFALHAAGVPPSHDAFRRGVSFLVRTQAENGSWPMASRPTFEQQPEGAGATSLRPITAAGSAWGALGLIRSVAKGVRPE